MLVEVKHMGYWITDEKGVHRATTDESCNRNSIMLTSDCLLYVYKLALRHLLLSRGVITEEDIDPANAIPHIKVRSDAKDPFSKYKKIQGKKFLVEESMLSVKSDFLTIELDEKLDLHCTMIYSKGLKKRVDSLEAFKEMLTLLNKNPDMIQEYAALPYFGQDAIAYWVETKDAYPKNITPPKDWKPAQKITDEEKFSKFKVSPAGSVIGL